jgi:hypothetical protein
LLFWTDSANAPANPKDEFTPAFPMASPRLRFEDNSDRSFDDSGLTGKQSSLRRGDDKYLSVKVRLEADGDVAAVRFNGGSIGAQWLDGSDKKIAWRKLTPRLQKANYLAAEDAASGYQGVFGRGNKLWLARFSSQGVLKRARRLRSNQIDSAEQRFGVDLNADGRIGAAEISAPAPAPAAAILSEAASLLPIGPSDQTQIGGGGTTPIGGGSTPSPQPPQPITITTPAPAELNGIGGVGLQRFGTDQAEIRVDQLDPTLNAADIRPDRNGLDQFLTNLLGQVRGNPGFTADVGVLNPNDPATAELPQFDIGGVRNYLGGRADVHNFDVNGVPLADAAQLTNSQGVTSDNWARSGGTFIRLTNANWGGEVGQPVGYEGSFGVDTTPRLVEGVDQALPNARLVSNLLGAQDAPIPNVINGVDDLGNPATASWNVYLMSFGQYFDHGLDFLARSGANQAFASATDPGSLTSPADPLHAISRGSVGVVGDRGAQFVRRSGTQELVQVAWFDNPGATLAPGLYSFTNANGVLTPHEAAATIAGVQQLGPNDLVYKNLTEALIQNNQMYGSSDAVAYLLRESARFDTTVNGQPAFTDANGTVYIAGESLAGTPWMVQAGAAGDLVKLVPDPSLEPQELEAISQALSGDFLLVKTAEILKSRLVTGDGMPGLPTYGEVLINNGVDPARVQAVLTGQGGNGSALGSPEWNYLAADPRFVDPGNVYDFSPANSGFTGQPLIGDIALAVTANSLTDPSQMGRLSAIDQNLDGIPDVMAGQSGIPEQPAIRGEDWGAGLLLSHGAGGDWRANENVGLTTIHTMWAREHNYWVNALKQLTADQRMTGISEEEFFQMARVLVEAEYQKLVFEQFAPALAGEIPVNFTNFPDPLDPADHGFDGYNPTVDPSISLEFAVAAYRVGHSQIPNEILPGISMLDGFLNPQLTASLGSTAIQAGLIGVAHDAIDTMLTDGVRNNLVTRNLDLFAANVLRGREVGLASMNAMRAQLSGFDSSGTFMYESVALGADGIEGTADDGTGSGLAPQQFMPLNLNNGTDITRGILGADALYGTADDVLENNNGFVGNLNLKPYASWAEFGDHLRGADAPAKDELLAKFIAAYDPAAASAPDRMAYATDKVAQIRSADPAADPDLANYAAGLDAVDAWVGMLAEEPQADGSTGQMGSLMAAVFWEQLDRLQEGDPFYYINRVESFGQRFWAEGLSPLEEILARTNLPGLMDQMPSILNPPLAEPVADPLAPPAPHVPTVFFTQGNLVGTDLIDQVTNPNGTGAVPGLPLPSAAATDPNNLVLDQTELMAQYELIGTQLRHISFLYSGGETVDPWNGFVAANVGANFADPNQASDGNSPSVGLGSTFSDPVFQNPQVESSVTFL